MDKGMLFSAVFVINNGMQNYFKWNLHLWANVGVATYRKWMDSPKYIIFHLTQFSKMTG